MVDVPGGDAQGVRGLSCEVNGGHLPYITGVPKIIGSSLAEHRAATRQRVFDALVALLETRSFDAISMADLAAEAGIGRTSIYNHFPDKDAVIGGFASSETSRYLDRLAEVLDGFDDPVERLRLYVRHHIETQGEQHFGFGPEIYAQLSPATLVAIREHVVEVETVVRTILADGVSTGAFRVEDPDAAVALIHACLQPRHVSADSVAEFVLRALRA